MKNAEPLSSDTLNAILENFLSKRRNDYQKCALTRRVQTYRGAGRLKSSLNPTSWRCATLKVLGKTGKPLLLCIAFLSATSCSAIYSWREPIISIAENVLGEHCHCIAQGCILNRKDLGINRFHVDDGIEFPIAPEMDRHDPRLRMPVLRMSVQIALTDQDDVKYGPSQFVPGSHYSGRQPDDPEHPTFEGRGPTSLLMKAGGSLSTQRANLASRGTEPDRSSSLSVSPSLRTTVCCPTVLALSKLPHAGLCLGRCR